MIAVTYADKNYAHTVVEKRAELKRLGFDHRHFDEEYLKSSGFYNQHLDIMGKLPNSGCVWKPYIIRVVMESSNENDIIVYSDCGDTLLNGVKDFVQYKLEKENFLFIETMYSHRRFTKKYLFKAMNCMEDKYLNANQLDAGFIAFRVVPETIMFVTNWEQLCYKPELILDQAIDGDEWEDLIRHSRDQSILTNLQLMFNLPFISIYDFNAKYIVYNKRHAIPNLNNS